MNTTLIKERFDQLQEQDKGNGLGTVRKNAYNAFNKWGIPTSRHEEWKYTRIAGLFNKEYVFAAGEPSQLSAEAIASVRLPGHENANELVFINGVFSFAHSSIKSSALVVLPLEEAAANEFAPIVSAHFGHSSQYLKDGINALNTALVQGGVFVHVKKGQVPEHPVYIYHVADTGKASIFSQPRSLVHIAENAQLQMVETYATLGNSDSFTNQVMEIVLEKDALLELYKIQNDAAANSQVSTTHIRQLGKSYTHVVTISLNGGIVRNNLNLVLEAAFCEAHLYGLYFQAGQTHIDNHTVVDNVKPNCLSNELYKGVMNDKSTAVFNGKIFVQPQAQKTNAYQSNKNILLSADASVNTKPQLEIFADDVKCSHGCTIGQLDEEGMFYLQSRGINETVARSLLVHAFAIDILEHVKPAAIREYVDKLISERLEFDIA
ncbi:MAG TPA: Fe-S cluster assembly protein SufD [Chitinophagaceae bacterium]|nr:Fe-S cluster assembly protein SufD [Chitinophagaceae bacterium]